HSIPTSLTQHPAHPHLPSFPTRRSSDLIGIHHPNLPLSKQALHAPQRVFGPTTGSKPIAVLAEVALKYRFEHPSQGTLHDAISQDRKSTRLNSSHVSISYAVFCLKKKNK